MNRKNETYWKNHIDKWKRSGDTNHKYSKENGLIQSTFQRWIIKLDSKIKPVKIELPKIVPETSQIIIEAFSIKFSIPANTDPSILAVIIRELKQCS